MTATMLTLGEVLSNVKRGKLSVRRAESILKLDYLTVIDKIARYDSKRYLRRGVPEIIYAKSKSSEELSKIVSKLVTKNLNKIELPIIISKIRGAQVESLEVLLKRRKIKKMRLKYFANASMAAIVPTNISFLRQEKIGRVALLAAGTSDILVVNEAEVLLNLLGCRTIRFNDVGVAALHRLLAPLEKINEFDPDSVIVAAGMEGALPSVIAGLSGVPVIGVPTSVGDGYGKDGEAALMSMLQACSLGICVVNIDGGVAAAVIAWLISRRASRNRRFLI